MNVVVVGGSGFIGTNLIEDLRQDERYDIVNIDKVISKTYPSITRIADIRDKEKLGQVLDSNDWCVMLAAEHRDDVTPTSLYFDVNVAGNKNIIDLLEKKKVQKIIFASTVAIYGLNKPNPDEDFPAAPFNDYGESKWQAEELLRSWYNRDADNRSLIILRPTVVFGPGNRGNVYNLLRQIASHKFLMVGKGNNEKSMAYVKNISGFIKYCMDKGMMGYHVFNYADKPDLTMNDLVRISEEALRQKLPSIRVPYFLGYLGGLCFDALAKLTGRKYAVSSVRVKKFCANTCYMNKRVLESGYIPGASLQEGLATTIQAIAIEDQ